MLLASNRKLSSGAAHELRTPAGARLRELRESRGLTQRQLAHMVGLETYSIIAQLESGYGRIPPERHAALAQALGLAEPEALTRLLSDAGHRPARGSRAASTGR